MKNFPNILLLSHLLFFSFFSYSNIYGPGVEASEALYNEGRELQREIGKLRVKRSTASRNKSFARSDVEFVEKKTGNALHAFGAVPDYDCKKRLEDTIASLEGRLADEINSKEILDGLSAELTGLEDQAKKLSDDLMSRDTYSEGDPYSVGHRVYSHIHQFLATITEQILSSDVRVKIDYSFVTKETYHKEVTQIRSRDVLYPERSFSLMFSPGDRVLYTGSKPEIGIVVSIFSQESRGFVLCRKEDINGNLTEETVVYSEEMLVFISAGK